MVPITDSNVAEIISLLTDLLSILFVQETVSNDKEINITDIIILRFI